jgi:hypothetical protein
MNRILRGSLIAGVIWTVALVRAADAVPLSVRIYNYAEVPEPVLETAQGEAIRIFLQAGIEVSWLPCARSDEEFAEAPHKFAACAQAVNAIIVRIQPKSLDGGAAHPRSAFAGAGEERVEVLYDRLQELSADQHFRGLILGHVMAHELGHLLLGEQSHSSQGIMVPTSRAKELLHAQKGLLLFTPQQAERMRHRAGGNRTTNRGGYANSFR